MPTVFSPENRKGMEVQEKSMGKQPLVLVVASRRLELSVFPITGVPKILRKTSVNSKFAFTFRNARRAEEAQRSVRLNLLFVKNKASWHEGPQSICVTTALVLDWVKLWRERSLI